MARTGHSRLTRVIRHTRATRPRLLLHISDPERLLTRFILPSRVTDSGQETMHRVGLLLGVCTVAGLLVAGVALPVVGGLGLAARRGAEQFDSLPSELKASPLPQRTRILAADGSVIAEFYYENRISVPLAQ